MPSPSVRSARVRHHGDPTFAPHPSNTEDIPLPGLWAGLSIAAAVIGGVGSIVGLLNPHAIYGEETAALADQAAAQDLTNLLVVSPLLVVLGLRAAHGSVRAYLCWLGCLAFTTYNYAIYAFTIHFGPLFLPWVAVLGLSTYALLGGAAALDTAAAKNWFAGRVLVLTGWVLVVLATFFALLWLSEIVPDLVAGKPSSSALEYDVPTNPVHVLDLAIYLPAVFASGFLLLRRHPVGYASSPGALVFLVLTCIPIVMTPWIADSRGHAPEWAVMLPIGTLLVATTSVLAWTLRSVDRASAAAETTPHPKLT
jgi:hypothetical protein